MRRTVAATVSTVVGLVLLLSFKSHGGQPSRLVSLPPMTARTPSPPAATTVPPTGSTTAPSITATRSITGNSVDTQYGPVQLRVTFEGSRIAAITPVQLPSGRSRDEEINQFAVPILTQEALAAQSANIDTVSGASYTSDGYAQSLQSAIDQARAAG